MFIVGLYKKVIYVSCISLRRRTALLTVTAAVVLIGKESKQVIINKGKSKFVKHLGEMVNGSIIERTERLAAELQCYPREENSAWRWFELLAG